MPVAVGVMSPAAKPQVSKSPAVIKADESREYYFKEGCFILECSNSADDPALSIARARVAPGVTTVLHALTSTTERYFLLSGSGVVSVDHVDIAVGAGDTVIIPENIPQQITNTGKVDLVFLALCTPRFLLENYREI